MALRLNKTASSRRLAWLVLRISPNYPQTMNSEINTNVRLFDLVRFMRSELHEAELITTDEYSWLLSEAPMAKGSGSPSPRRLEDYDRVKASYMEALDICEKSKNTAVNKWVGRLQIAEDALREIAKQNLRAEMDDHTGENADWEGGYEAIVLVARRALDSENVPEHPADDASAESHTQQPN